MKNPVIAALLIGLAAVAYWYRPTPPVQPLSAPTPEATHPGMQQEQPSSTTEESSPEEGRSQVVPEGISSNQLQGSNPQEVNLRGYLQGHWGGLWPQVAAELEAAGYDMDITVDPSQISTWDEIEEKVRQQIVEPDVDASKELWSAGYNKTLDDFALAKAYGGNGEPSEATLQAMRECAESYGPEFEAAADQLVVEVFRVRKQIWENQEFAKGPVYAAMGPHWLREEGQGLVTSLSVGGWEIQYRIDPTRDVYLTEAIDRLRDIRLRRFRELRKIR